MSRRCLGELTQINLRDEYTPKAPVAGTSACKRVPSALHIQPDAFVFCKLGDCLNVLGLCGIQRVYGIATEGAASFACPWVARDAGSIGEYRRARVVSPLWVPDADGIFRVEHRVEPACENMLTFRFVKV